jgi:excisionase family DNA binding protein
MENKDILKASEVASYLHLHVFTVHKLAREGKLPGFKIGNDWRFRRTVLEEWIEAKETSSGKKINTPSQKWGIFYE